MPSVSAVIAAGGVGSRFSSSGKKQFYEINGHPILYYTILKLVSLYDFEEFIIGADIQDHDYIRDIAKAGVKKLKLTENGDIRALTVLNALNEADGDYVMVHDAVRPFITKDTLINTIESAFLYSGAICGSYSVNTVKYATDGFADKTIDRKNVFLAFTPQVFKTDKIIYAMNNAIANGIELTDESSAFEYMGYPVKVISSSNDNIKLTFMDDIDTVSSLFKKYF